MPTINQTSGKSIVNLMDIIKYKIPTIKTKESNSFSIDLQTCRINLIKSIVLMCKAFNPKLTNYGKYYFNHNLN